MEHESIDVDAPITDVFAVLTSPRSYPDWLRGARRIRAVDDDWPAPGSAFHHVVGVPPLVLADETCVERVEAPTLLELRAKARPTGVARVLFRLTALDDTRTRVEIEEVPESGPGRWAWDLGGRLWMAPLLRARNRSSLRRLRHVVQSAAAVTG